MLWSFYSCLSVGNVSSQDKDTYGNEVTHMARPLPVEYLLVDMPAAFPVESLYTFKAASLGLSKFFPIENRANIGEPQVCAAPQTTILMLWFVKLPFAFFLQDFEAFSSYLQQLFPDQQFEGLSDFHILIFMATCDMLPVKVNSASLPCLCLSSFMWSSCLHIVALPFPQDEIPVLTQALRTNNTDLAHSWLKSEAWATVEQLIQAHSKP